MRPTPHSLTVASALLLAAAAPAAGQQQSFARVSGWQGTVTLSVKGDWTGEGPFHTCGVTTAGAFCWGYNASGQLGDGTTVNRASPVPVSGGLSFRFASFLGPVAGSLHACGVTTALAAFCWGSNGFGQLGDGSTVNKTSPGLVAGGLTFLALSAGAQHTCGVGPAGAFCWGLNYYGQLGDGSTANSPVPVRVVQ